MGRIRQLAGAGLLGLIGSCPIVLPALAFGSGPAPSEHPASEERDPAVRAVQAAPPQPTPPRPTPSPVGANQPSRPGITPSQPPAVGATPPAARPSGAGLAALPTLVPTTVAPPFFGPRLTGPEAFPLTGVPQMLGDLAPIFGTPRAVSAPSGTNLVRLPWVRGYKMADNQSPLPLDRVFATFYYYDDINVGDALAARAGIRDVDVYREFFGLEKTFLDRSASIGLRLPLNTITADLGPTRPAASSTALGDLTVFGKYALWGDLDRGEVVSLGLAVTPPTGPAEFAGADFTRARNPTYLQPFLGYLKPLGRWYVQGFTGINVPTDSRVVTMLYNDVGIGYYLYQSSREEAWVSAVIPSAEVHVNTPLNHRGGFSDVSDPGATIDSVNLTFGLNAVLRRRGVLSAGIVQSVTGPRPFELEAIVLLNIYFGKRSARTPPLMVPPAFGG